MKFSSVYRQLFIVLALLLAGCEASPTLIHPPTSMPFNPTPTPNPTLTPPAPDGTGVFLPTSMATRPPTPGPFANEEAAIPGLAGTYIVHGTAPDGKAYSGKLAIKLHPNHSSSSIKQAEYDLAWDTGSNGAGILIQDALANLFLASGFGGPTCSAVFYSVFPYMDNDTSTFTLYGIRFEPGTFEIGFETASPIVPRPYLEGDYNLVGYNANGNKYKGTLSITQQGASVWQLTWNVVLPTPGIGISLNKSLFAAAYGGEGCGVSVYKVNADGSLHATWAIWGVNQAGEETATK